MGRPISRIQHLFSLLPLQYKSPKYIKVDVPRVAIFNYVCKLLVVGAIFAQLYYNNGWALTEVPGGTSAARGLPSESTARIVDPSAAESLASETVYCSNAAFGYAEGTHRMNEPECDALRPSELVEGSSGDIFFMTSFEETDVEGWPCADAAEAGLGGAATANARSAACTAEGGRPFSFSSGQCGCERHRAAYTLAVEDMIMSLEHSYDTYIFNWKGSSASRGDAHEAGN